MGAGKTTLGKAFAREMSLNFIDLDWFIEERFHKTVQQLFLERGEDGFRELERKMLHEVAEFEDVVVSTGGGTPCFFDNILSVRRYRKDIRFIQRRNICLRLMSWRIKDKFKPLLTA